MHGQQYIKINLYCLLLSRQNRGIDWCCVLICRAVDVKLLSMEEDLQSYFMFSGNPTYEHFCRPEDCVEGSLFVSLWLRENTKRTQT